MAKRQRRTFTLEQKLEAIRKVEAGESTGSKMAKAMGVQPAQFYKWKKQLAVPKEVQNWTQKEVDAFNNADPNKVRARMEEPEYVTPDYRINFCPNCSADQRRLKDVDDDVHWCYRCGCCLHKIDLY